MVDIIFSYIAHFAQHVFRHLNIGKICNIINIGNTINLVCETFVAEDCATDECSQTFFRH